MCNFLNSDDLKKSPTGIDTEAEDDGLKAAMSSFVAQADAE